MERVIPQCSRALSRSLRFAAPRSIASTPSICTPLRQSRLSRERLQQRCFHAKPPNLMKSQPPKSRDRGPKSDEDTQTDFSALDVLRNTIAPATSIDACTSDGFALNNQVRITGSGVLLIGGEAFRWWPWVGGGHEGSNDKMEGKLLNKKGQWEIDSGGWGVLELVHPKPGTESLMRLLQELEGRRLICVARSTHYRHWSKCYTNCAKCPQVPERLGYTA
jgi:NADH dehydrogenase [ubiquinone] 1 alpha subcomplex assembly factor 3